MADAPQPNPHRHRAQLISLIALVLALGTPLVVGLINSHNKPPDPSLCDMLRSGWTTKEITTGDQWRDWPDSMSNLERTTVVLREAGRDCPKLVGL